MQSPADIANGYMFVGHAPRIDGDADLGLAAAEDDDLGDAVDIEQIVLDVIAETFQVQFVDRFRNGQTNDREHGAVDLGDDRVFGQVARQTGAIDRQCDLIRYLVTIGGIRIDLERDATRFRERHRSHLVDTVKDAQFLFNRRDDQLFDLFRRSARIARVDLDDIEVDVGKGFTIDAEHRVGAQGQQENGNQIDDQAALNQVGDNRFHRCCLPLSR